MSKTYIVAALLVAILTDSLVVSLMCVLLFLNHALLAAMARETATALRETNGDGPAKMAALRAEVPTASPLGIDVQQAEGIGPG